MIRCLSFEPKLLEPLLANCTASRDSHNFISERIAFVFTRLTGFSFTLLLSVVNKIINEIHDTFTKSIKKQLNDIELYTIQRI